MKPTTKEINKQKNQSITWLRKEVKRLQKENNRLEMQIESFANEFGYNVNEIK
tara:strand:+ start:448 stop:606 length:159 start_codon:yes stop_codon:yes gene_type:complete